MPRPSLALTLIAALAMVLPAHSGPSASEETAAQGTIGSVVHLLNQMAEPGPLAAAHAHLDNDASCRQCHTVDEGVPDVACLACHQVVALRREQRAGWHGLMSGRCIECHTDHVSREADIMPFDRLAFNHERAVFRLEGAHRDLDCRQCHVEHASPEAGGWQFLQLPQLCSACHESPHGSALSQECRQCHVSDRWQDVSRFDHERDTEFALVGAHRDIACAACHRGDRAFAPHGAEGEAIEAPFACASCHENTHRDAELTDCQRCHTTATWNSPRFDHAQTAFPLTGQHRLVGCAQCHRGQGDFALHGVDSQPVPTPPLCVSCHENIHRDRDLTTCQRCHTPDGWQPPAFNHETMSDFPLANLHAGVTCVDCHGPAVGEAEATFHARGTECTACHRDIEEVLSGARFAQALGRALPDTHHGAIRCEDCHSARDERTHLSLIAPRCVACHTPEHGQMLFEEARLVEETLQRLPRDPAGRIAEGPFAGLSGSDIIHNAGAWISAEAIQPTAQPPSDH